MEGGLAGRRGNNLVLKLQVGLDPRDRQIAVSDQTPPAQHAFAMRLYGGASFVPPAISG